MKPSWCRRWCFEDHIYTSTIAPGHLGGGRYVIVTLTVHSISKPVDERAIGEPNGRLAGGESAKANALNKPANGAVKDLVRWGDYFKTEPGKQSPLERLLGSSKYDEELHPETIELKRRDIELRAYRLRNMRGELEKSARPS